MASVYDVAAYIERELGGLSEYKLQKLVYYAQAWSLAWEGRVLFPEVIKAWPDGPVSPQLWHRRENAVAGDPAVLSREDAETVLAVLECYGSMKPNQLIDLSHREKPWRDARRGLKPGEHGYERISTDAMRRYYGSMAEPGVKKVPEAVRRGMDFLLAVPENQIDDLFKPSEIDGEALLSWLETGEGDPWREGS